MKGNNVPNVDDDHGDLFESSLIESEQDNGSSQVEAEALEFPGKHEATEAATKELLNILGIIALRIAAKIQRQGIDKK